MGDFDLPPIHMSVRSVCVYVNVLYVCVYVCMCMRVCVYVCMCMGPVWAGYTSSAPRSSRSSLACAKRTRTTSKGRASDAHHPTTTTAATDTTHDDDDGGRCQRRLVVAYSSHAVFLLLLLLLLRLPHSLSRPLIPSPPRLNTSSKNAVMACIHHALFAN